MNSAPLLDYDSDYGGFDSDEDETFGFVDVSNINIQNQPPVDPQKELRSRIQSAASEGNVSELEDALFNNTLGFTVDSLLDGNWTSLMYACTSSQPEIVDFLLKNGANPNITEAQSGLNPLLCACLSKSINSISNEVCVKLLIDKKAKINVMDKYRETPLMIAIENSKTYVANMLIPHSNLDVKDLQGRTAIHYAVIHNQHETLKQLIKAGASLKVVDYEKLSIRELALNKNHKQTLEVLKEYLEETNPKKDSETNQSYEVIKDWKDMYPGVLSSEKPAYWHEIPRILYGMHCEKLIPTFKNSKIDLFTFLTMTENDIDKLTEFPYLRNRLKSGLLKFHLHRWNMETVSGYPTNRKVAIDYTTCLSYFGSHMAQVTVIKSSFCYLNKIINLQKVELPLEVNKNIDMVLSQIARVKLELKKSKEIIHKVNKLSVVPPDLILPQIQKRNYISKKKIIYCSILLAIYFTTAFKLKHV